MTRRWVRWALAGIVLACVAAAAVALSPLVRPGRASSPDPDDTVEPLSPAEPAEHASALDILDRLAERAAQQPVAAPASGQLLHRRTESSTAGVRRRQDVWVDLTTTATVRIRSVGGADADDWPAPGRSRDRDEVVNRAKDALTRYGPSIVRPTPAWAAGLSSDPTVLLADLRAGVAASGAARPDLALVDGVTVVLRDLMGYLAPAQRRAIYQVLARLPSVGVRSADPVEIDGRSLVAVTMYASGDRTDLLFDPGTGLANGRRIGAEVWDIWICSVVNTVEEPTT
jgi:hypothetical protein